MKCGSMETIHYTVHVIPQDGNRIKLFGDYYEDSTNFLEPEEAIDIQPECHLLSHLPTNLGNWCYGDGKQLLFFIFFCLDFSHCAALLAKGQFISITMLSAMYKF